MYHHDRFAMKYKYLKNDLSKDLVSILDMFDIFTELGLEDVLSGNAQIELNESDKEKFTFHITVNGI